MEVRNGSGNVLKQQVWGQRYVDELVQVRTNSDPTADDTCDTLYWVCQDANYNVLGVIDAISKLVERYEYTPYGERTVFFSPGANDPDLMAPTLMSRRVPFAGGVNQPYGLNEFGHQGLHHDEELALVYNRARTLHPTLGRFVQRDPLGYVDGMGLYEYVRSGPPRALDPEGLACMVRFSCGLVGSSSGAVSTTCNYNCVEVSRVDSNGGTVNCSQLPRPQVISDSHWRLSCFTCPATQQISRSFSDWSDPFSNCSASACLTGASVVYQDAVETCNLIRDARAQAVCIAAASAVYETARGACSLCEQP